jgi:DNA-binding MarR family transcriptional regulator
MAGFQAPNYTQVPNDFFDLVMEMTEAETRIITALIRITFGYHRDEIQMSVRDIAKATKMSTSSVWVGAEKLENRGLIERSVSKSNTVTNWRVVISDTQLYRQIVKTVSNDSEQKGIPPLKKEKKERKLKDAPAAKAPTPAEVLLFREVTERYPPKPNFEDVVKSIAKMRDRLGRAVTKEDLKPFYAAWCHKGYKPINLSWLEWAETGQIPVNGNWKPKANEPKAFEAIRQWIGDENGKSRGNIESDSPAERSIPQLERKQIHDASLL